MIVMIEEQLLFGVSIVGYGIGRAVVRLTVAKKESIGRNKMIETRNSEWRAPLSERVNEKFDQYYKKQEIVSESEWPILRDCLATDLPITFRIVSHTPQTNYLLHRTQDIMEKYPGACQPIPWLPDNLAYQLNVTKAQLRSDAALKEFHQLIIVQAEAGNLFRQEAVSMIPVHLLHIEPHHVVLDMCSAPGSKTSQILEKIHSPPSASSTPTSSPTTPLIPSGVCIANDFNVKRAHMLIHHVGNMNSPNLIVTTHQAQLFPSMFDPTTSDRLQFDRILADVPCSGDGTLRKAPNLWKQWNELQGMNLHKLQLQIAKRAVTMLKKNGRMVYSTCSLNPIENEAVVAALLREMGDSVRLVDVRSELEGLDRVPGLLQWKVCVGESEYTNLESMQTALRRKARNLTSSMFCVESPEVLKEKYHLDYCMRLHSHLSNTGSFFVAVLEKYEDLVYSVDEKKKPEGEEAKEEKNGEPEEKKRRLDYDEIEKKEVEEFEKETERIIEEEAEENKKMSRNEKAEQEAYRPEYFKNRRRCVNMDSVPSLSSKLISALWENMCIPYGIDRHFAEREAVKLMGEKIHLESVSTHEDVESILQREKIHMEHLPALFNNLFVRTSVAESYHRIIHQKKQAMKNKKQAIHSKNQEGEKKEGEEKNEAGKEEKVLFKPTDIEIEKEYSPKKLYLVSDKAAHILRMVGRSPYKVLSAGCTVFESNRSATGYRITMTGAKYLLHSIWQELLTSSTLPLSPLFANQSLAKHYSLQGKIVFLPEDLFIKAFAIENPTNRLSIKLHDTPTEEKNQSEESEEQKKTDKKENTPTRLSEEEIQWFSHLERESTVVLATVNKKTHQVIAVPAWLGKVNLEVLLDSYTKKSIVWGFAF